VIENKPHLTLYSRRYCHLCDDMLAALDALRSEGGKGGEFSGGFDVSVVDVDTDPELIARYDELVPVLVGDTENIIRELCHYRLDVTAVRAYLGEFR